VGREGGGGGGGGGGEEEEEEEEEERILKRHERRNFLISSIIITIPEKCLRRRLSHVSLCVLYTQWTQIWHIVSDRLYKRFISETTHRNSINHICYGSTIIGLYWPNTPPAQTELYKFSSKRLMHKKWHRSITENIVLSKVWE
jgi:hypothetical protein